MSGSLDDLLRRVSIEVSQWPTWKQNILRDSGSPVRLPTKRVEYHLSFEGADPGSFIHACEAWMLGEGLQIPRPKYHLLYQAMQDQFMQSDAYSLWAKDQEVFYKHVYDKRDS